jgi:hypothetical protein
MIGKSDVLFAHAPTDPVRAAVLTSQFPSLTNAPSLLRSMDMQPEFMQGEPSENVATLLKRIQLADPASPDIDDDNRYDSWGHYQFTAGGLSPSSSLTTWQDFGNVATALKLVAAALKTCQDARAMCANADPLKKHFISDIYLEQVLEHLEKCWVDAGGVCIHILLHIPLIHHLLSRQFLLAILLPTTVTSQRHILKSSCRCNHPSQMILLQPPQSLRQEPTRPTINLPLAQNPHTM